jgi:hypothetical protein
MAIVEKVSPVTLGLCVALSVLALIFYIGALSLLANLTGSDPAGNAYAQAYAAIAMAAVWLLLAIVVTLALIRGAAGWPVVVAAIVLIPAAAIASMAAQGLLASPSQPPYLWPIVIPAGIPLLVLAFAFWTLLPGLRAMLPGSYVGLAIWGAVLLLCMAIVPFSQIRNNAEEAIVTARAATKADYEKLPADAGLAVLLPFMGTLHGDMDTELTKRVRALPTRQSEAEAMLARGEFPLRYLGQLELDPTTSLCDKARAQLRGDVAPLVLKAGETKPYAVIAQKVSDAVIGMSWLVGHDCSCDAEALAWEQMASAYTDPNYDFYQLKRLRDPQELGRILREYPERFSMLTPKASLNAWLSFADQEEYRDRALAGARTLPHRNADIIAMLNNRSDPGAPWTAMTYLTQLDLEATPQLCRAALGQIDLDFSKVYRPAADDPRSYDELLDRLGGRGRQFSVLIWLAERGCAAGATIGNAEGLIRSYQGSAQSEAMLAALGRLPRKQ